MYVHACVSVSVCVQSTYLLYVYHPALARFYYMHPVLMIRVENCPDTIVNVLTSPLIMYSKFVWSNLIGSVEHQSWLENV